MSQQPKTNSAKLSTAKIDWSESQPHSSAFDDIYFSQQSGTSETEHVFINANNLPKRFADQDPQRPFVIAETGFGTGLNFLCARKLWLKAAPKTAQLHFISCEKYPFTPADLKQAHQLFAPDPELASGCEQLQKLWPKPVSGFHRLNLDQGRIQLTLLYGDATEMLSQLNAQIDCWFLDGFAPSKNPEMWREELFAQLRRLSHAKTTLATFTCAGLVRRGLKASGFEIRKIPGYGRKREMLCADFVADGVDKREDVEQQPWLKRPPTRPKSGPIAIIGGGLSGATTAFALARRGYQVDLYEQHPELATEGSGNPQGALYAKLPAKPTPQSRLHLAGLNYSVQLLQSLGFNDGQIADLCGLLQLALHEKEVKRFQQVVTDGAYPAEVVQGVSQEEATELAGTECAGPALYFPDAGWVSPAKFSRALCDHPNIQLKRLEPVEKIQTTVDGWRVGAGDRLYRNIILCTAWRTELFDNWHSLGLKPIRGQTTWVNATSADSLAKVVCGKGYISPALDGQYCFGSSFVIGDQSAELRDAEHQHNLQILKESLPELAEALVAESFSGKATQRAGSRDYVPLVGALCDQEELISRYKALKIDARTRFKGDAPWVSGLYVNLGHGSKGLITCPLSAEVLAAQINAEPYPIEQPLVEILSPQRFTIRDLIRSEG